MKQGRVLKEITGEGVVATVIESNAYQRFLMHLAGDTVGWPKLLYDLMLKADRENLNKLAKVYPDESHAVWLYKTGGSKAVAIQAEEETHDERPGTRASRPTALHQS